jgi:TFIIIC subunit triple barrel domain
MGIDMHVVLVVPGEVAAKIRAGAPYTLTQMDSTQPTISVDGETSIGRFEDILGTDLAFDPTLAAATPTSTNAGLVAVATKRLVFEKPSSKKE